MSAREEFETGLDLFATADDAGALFGVSGESGSGIGQGSILFDVGQLDKFATSYYQAGLEAAAKVCDNMMYADRLTKEACAKYIRKLKDEA